MIAIILLQLIFHIFISKYYQKNRICSKNTKNENMLASDIRVFQMVRNKSQLSLKPKVIKNRKIKMLHSLI